MNQFLRFLPVFFALTLGACASNEPAATATTAPPGFVVGSITHETSNGSYRLGIAGKPGQRIREPSVGGGLLPFSNQTDDDLKEKGGTFELELPPGEYRIVRWSIRRGSTDTQSAQPFEISFTVESGKISYLGNLHFDPHWENVSLRDRASRDMPILLKRTPKLATLEVAYTIRKDANLERLGNGYKSRSDIPFIMPLPAR
ncbi:MAG: hypothetical protein ACK5QH_19290 [Rubrivivax sp.]|jgi:hypothetical protein